ncbi:mechanosensitive ion channel [Pseudodesulfovibrio sp.]|nr:mechanosensitive ion channel [Pseudodesulfovibrio sp.]
MNKIFEKVVPFLTDWLQTNVLTWETGAQWLCAVGALLLAIVVWAILRKRISQWVEGHVKSEFFRSMLLAFTGVGGSALLILLLQTCAAAFTVAGITPIVLDAVSILAVAWIVIRLLSGIISNPALSKCAAISIWIVAALRIFGLLAPITDFLHGLSINVGDTSINALGFIQGIILAAIFLQGAAIMARFAARRIEKVKDLSPSLQVLTIKAIKVVLYTVALLFAMSSVGIDLTSLAIFSSALGVGIGFGLKTIFSNYVAGILLLMDNSIKPGDTIEVGQVFGVVRDMHGRYTSVLTRDGMEYLIPNELLITGEVVNWTYSDTNIRIKIPVGIAYHSDVDTALALLKKATEGVERVLRTPAPAARLVGFGDSSVDLDLRVWIADAEDGVASVRSDILRNVWNLFHENDVEFPFPQRDVLLKADSQLSVKVTREDTDE